MNIDPNIESDYLLATPDKTIVNSGGKPIKKPKNTTTTEGKKVSEDEALAKLTTQLPDVKGYRILCMVPEADEKYESGLIKSDSVKQIQEHSTVVLFVMQLGDLAYQDEARFPSGAWCKEGDFVITRAYAGTRIKIHGKEFRIINDDTVEAVVDDPRGYERAQEIDMADIINEIPEELEMEGEEVEVDLSKKSAKTEKSTADVERVEEPKKVESELEVEEEDDTPPEDRGKEPLPKEIVEEVENDTLEGYSDRVKQRFAQLKKMQHDERREKERAEREKNEAIAYAQKVMEQNKKLQSTLSDGEETYLKTLEEKYTSDLAVAKRNYSEAYDSGDTEKIVSAQEQMNEAQFKLNNAKNQKPQYNKPLQAEPNSVDNTPTDYKPDPRAKEWQDNNQWFGKNKVMTATALGLHDELLSEGIQVSSDAYYRRIDDTMQKLFPENFGKDPLESDKPAQRKPSNVVAPATRSTAPKKVRLSKTQVAFAKKLKLTPEQYAREMIKLENANG